MRFLLASVVLVAPAFAAAAGITDYSSHKQPSLSLPSAGRSYIDPVFGTKVIRVTDSSYGTHCYHAYSYWPAFNYNSTRLLLACDDKALLFRFDPSTDTVTKDGTLQGTTGYHVQWEGAVWSTTSSSIIYAVDQYGTRIWKIDVSNRGAGGYTQLKDVSSKFGSGVYLDQMTMSDNADVFSFHTRSKSTGARLDVAVWVRSTNTIYVMPRSSGYSLDESKVSRAGRYVMVNYNDGTMVLWDFKAGTKKWFDPDVYNDDVGGHYDVGSDFIANSDQTRAGMAIRTYGDLRPPDHAVRYKRPDGSDNWSLCDHVSLRTADETFFIGSTYAGDGSWGAFEKEIYLGYTDGHGFVRLAHTRSAGKETSSEWKYRAQPRAVVDRLGRYVVFTSDLGSSSRMDVLIVKIPSIYREN